MKRSILGQKARTGSWLGAFVAAGLVVGGAACSDSGSSANDGGTSPDGGTTTEAAAGVAPVASGLNPSVVALSEGGHDRLFGATFDAAGNLLATGVVSDGKTADADLAMVVARFKPDGTLDATFGDKGIARKNVAVGKGGEVARGIVVQSSGKIVIAGTVEHAGATDARDRDIAVVRFDANGALDTTFGDGGVVLLDLSTGEVAGESFVADGHWGLNVFPNDDLLVAGSRKADGRADSDFAVVKLKGADGARDTSFGTGGVFTLDIAQKNASPKSAIVLADGSAVVSGYSQTAEGVVAPVLFKLTPAGALDTTFANGGLSHVPVLGAVTEAYGVVQQGTSFVTNGYGRDSASQPVDWVSLRFDATGALDKSYGEQGVTRFDVAGFGDNGRALTALPDERILLVGGGRPAETNVDAMIALLTKDGKPDTTFAEGGRVLHDLGGASDVYWAAAVSPTKKLAAVVGVRGVAADSGDDDDSALVLLPLAP